MLLRVVDNLVEIQRHRYNAVVIIICVQVYFFHIAVPVWQFQDAVGSSEDCSVYAESVDPAPERVFQGRPIAGVPAQPLRTRINVLKSGPILCVHCKVSICS